MKCPECHAENPEAKKFCRKCGTKLSLVCPQCGSEILPDDIFCGDCGHKLSLPSEPPSAAEDLSFDDKLDKIQRYLPKGLTEKILAQRDRIEGERKQVTVMFCDMEGFTKLSENLGPETAYGVMDQVYEILIHKVHEFEGTVNEMTGDGIMALFGAPIALEDAPQRAIRSAHAIHKEMASFSDRMKQDGGGIRPIKMRVGIHTGTVVVGTLGNTLRVEFKAVGDTVNLASRMEQLAEPGTTYVTEDVFSQTEGLFQFEALGKKEVKGKKKPITVYRVIAPSTRRTRFDISTLRGLTPFVGRERELELLLEGFERSREGKGQAFSIMAEAGMGKSRLLYEFRKALAVEDVTYLEGKCLSYSRGTAYHPIIDVLKSNFDIEERDGDLEIRKKVKEGLQALRVDEAATFPYLLELLSVKNSGIDEIPLSLQARKDRIIQALIRTVLKASEMHPVAVAIEDLHWIDESSEEALKCLLDAITGSRVFLMFTYRPEFVHTWGAKSYHSQVNLNRLSNRESLIMLNHLLGTKQIESALEEFILEKTEGIPFFIEEFIKSLTDLQIIEKTDQTYSISKDIQTVTIPTTIHDVIMARVDSLPEKVKSVLQTGSVVGREFSHDLIKATVRIPEQELLAYLSALKDSELLYERGVFPHSTYIFKHAFTQEVVYGSLLVKRREEIHRGIGEIIEGLYSERLEEFYEVLAHHYTKGKNDEKAYHYLKLSGNKATRNYSMKEASHFYRTALDVLAHLPISERNKKEEIEVRLSLSTPITFTWSEDTIQIVQKGVEVSKEIDDKRSLSFFYSKLALFNALHGEPALAMKYCEVPFKEAKESDDIDLMAPIACELCTSYLYAGEFCRTIDVTPRVLDTLEKTHREHDYFGTRYNAYSGLCSHYGLALSILGRFDEAKPFFNKGRDFALKAGSIYGLGFLEFFYGLSYGFAGNGKQAVDHLEKSVRYLKESQNSVVEGFARSGLGYGFYLLGDLEGAKNHLERGITILKNLDIPVWLCTHFLFMAIVSFDAGDLREARKCIDDALEVSLKTGERHWEGLSRVWQGRILNKCDASRLGESEEYIRKGLEILQDLQLRPFLSQGYLFLGELYVKKDRREKALEHLKMAEKMFQEMGMDYWLEKTREILKRL